MPSESALVLRPFPYFRPSHVSVCLSTLPPQKPLGLAMLLNKVELTITSHQALLPPPLAPDCEEEYRERGEARTR